MTRRLIREQEGQILPVVLFFFVVILAAGLIVFWVGAATSQASDAQTAADAAALAGENTLVQEIDQGSELLSAQGFSTAAVCASADGYAHRNHAHVISCTPVVSANSSVGYDVEVTVRGDGSLPASSPAAGSSPEASARASTDPAAQASTDVQDDESCTQGDVTAGSPFSPHSGHVGFFAAGGTNFGHGCESRIAGALDTLAGALNLHLTDTQGYVAGGGSTTATAGTGVAAGAGVAIGAASAVAGVSASGATTRSDAGAASAALYACGALADVQGLGSVSSAVLAKYDLERPFAGEPDEVQLTDQGCNATDSTQTASVQAGNLNVHLVPMDGGPQGSFISVVGGGGSVSIGESELQVGCQIYGEWKSLVQSGQIPKQYSEEALRVAFLTAADESDFGQNIGPNRTDPGASIGVYQQISNDGWGTMSEELNPTTAAALFFLGGTSPSGAGATGLMTHLEADPDLPLYELAQKTQGSGAGDSSDGADNYGMQYPAEQAMYDQVTSGKCAHVAG